MATHTLASRERGERSTGSWDCPSCSATVVIVNSPVAACCGETEKDAVSEHKNCFMNFHHPFLMRSSTMLKMETEPALWQRRPEIELFVLGFLCFIFMLQWKSTHSLSKWCKTQNKSVFIFLFSEGKVLLRGTKYLRQHFLLRAATCRKILTRVEPKMTKM